MSTLSSNFSKAENSLRFEPDIFFNLRIVWLPEIEHLNKTQLHFSCTYWQSFPNFCNHQIMVRLQSVPLKTGHQLCLNIILYTPSCDESACASSYGRSTLYQAVEAHRVVRRQAPIFSRQIGSQMAMRSALRAGHPLPPRKIPGTYFCQRLSRPQGHSAAGRIRSIERTQWPNRKSNSRPSGL
jgi:hypothetical protein